MRSPSSLLIVSLGCALAAGCDPFDPLPSERRSAGADGTLAVPPAIASLRSIESDRLSAFLSIDGRLEPTVRTGARWIGRFDVAPGSSVAFHVEWRYALDEGELVIARSPTRRIDGASTVRDIVVSDYDTASFDVDRDGVDNLAEIAAGTDPFTANAGDGVREFALALPVPGIVDTVVPPEELTLDLRLDGEPVLFTRDGATWRGSFVIGDDRTHRFRATWSTVFAGRELILVQSASIAFDRGSTDEDLRIPDYADSPFDADGDRVTNLAELAEGTDPFAP